MITLYLALNGKRLSMNVILNVFQVMISFSVYESVRQICVARKQSYCPHLEHSLERWPAPSIWKAEESQYRGTFNLGSSYPKKTVYIKPWCQALSPYLFNAFVPILCLIKHMLVSVPRLNLNIAAVLSYGPVSRSSLELTTLDGNAFIQILALTQVLENIAVISN